MIFFYLLHIALQHKTQEEDFKMTKKLSNYFPIIPKYRSSAGVGDRCWGGGGVVWGQSGVHLLVSSPQSGTEATGRAGHGPLLTHMGAHSDPAGRQKTMPH